MDNTIKNNNNNNNAMYKNDSQRTITGHINNNYVLSSIQFSLKLGDLDQPWFHKFATRQSAIEMLTNQPVGTFIIRPSSRGCYAMSWVSETKEIKHNLIYNHFPGYSLSSPNDAVVGKKYETLTQLVENTEFLKQHIPSNQHPKRDTTKSSTELILRLFEKLLNNDRELTSLQWELRVLEGPDTYSHPEKCEHRTFIRYCDEEYVAPFLVKLETEIAQELFKTLEVNTTLKTLIVRGFEGLMHLNFTPNLRDDEMKALCSALRWNSTLTHLDLSCNKISDEGAKALADVIRENRTLALKTINLRCNFIRQDGLRALASSLHYNNTIDSLDVANQLFKEPFNSTISLCTDPFEKTLISLIEDSFQRKRELLASTSWCPSFHRWLSLSEVQNLLTNAPVGSFLFFLNRNLPNVIFLAYSTPSSSHTPSNHHPQQQQQQREREREREQGNMLLNSDPSRHQNCVIQTLHNHDEHSMRRKTPSVVIHYRPIYRTDFGYSFTRPSPDSGSCNHNEQQQQQQQQQHNYKTIPSLFDHCLWYLCGDSKKLDEYRGHFNSEIETCVSEIENLTSLWQLQSVPLDNNDPRFSSTKNVYPTLTNLIQRNKNILKHPVICSSSDPNHSDSDYIIINNDFERKSNVKMRN